MSVLFVDTSAIMKRYLKETASEWMIVNTEPTSGHLIVLSELAFVEFRSVLKRRTLAQQMNAIEGYRLHQDFLLHVKQQYFIINIERPIVQEAGALCERHGLRTLDAIQLACALEAQTILAEPVIFVCADNRLLSVAQTEGLHVDNPYWHTNES